MQKKHSTVTCRSFLLPSFLSCSDWLGPFLRVWPFNHLCLQDISHSQRIKMSTPVKRHSVCKAIKEFTEWFYIYIYILLILFSHFSILRTSIRADKNKTIIGLILSIENKGRISFPSFIQTVYFRKLKLISTFSSFWNAYKFFEKLDRSFVSFMTRNVFLVNTWRPFTWNKNIREMAPHPWFQW